MHFSACSSVEARGLLLVHTHLLRRIGGSRPCRHHSAQQSSASGFEDWRMAAGGVLRGLRPRFFSSSSLLCKAFPKGMNEDSWCPGRVQIEAVELHSDFFFFFKCKFVSTVVQDCHTIKNYYYFCSWNTARCKQGLANPNQEKCFCN